MDEKLTQAYRTAEYCLWLNHTPVALRIDQPATDILATLTAQAGLQDHAYVITPCNPGSKALDADANRERLRRFRARLNADAVRWLPAANRDPSGQWPDEPGALLIDCGETYAINLGRDYAQHAIVEMTRAGVPRLITL